MDTTEIYIKMVDCPEVQGQSPCHYNYADNRTLFSSGDKVHIDKYRKGSFKVDSEYNFFIGGWWAGRMNHLWLPRQDQIQEMVGYPMLYCLRMLYMKFKPGFEPDSFEQLWLAFYMYELHSKTWDGEKWIKK